jgi:hypothetical protein
MNPTQDQEQSPEALYQATVESYLKGKFALRAHDFGVTPETVSEAWGHIKGAVDIKLEDDNSVTYNGSPKSSTMDLAIVKLREKSPELFPRFGKKQEPTTLQADSPQETTKTAQSAPRQVPAQNLVVSETDVSSASWMRANGMKFLADGSTLFDALRSGTVKVTKDASQATLNVDRDLSVDLGAKSKELPTTVIPRGKQNDRLYLRKVEQKYASIGGFTEAVRRNLVTFEK